jgi:hypothetical protein
VGHLLTVSLPEPHPVRRNVSRLHLEDRIKTGFEEDGPRLLVGNSRAARGRRLITGLLPKGKVPLSTRLFLLVVAGFEPAVFRL